ncbi:hypothetical protein RFI_11012 [Reticulomyxa filosa]|uniref:Uncharacterized protein n=1 Tax=Reticulomyxa filosa TaxID=46433 RepID=X6NJE4_RETFI|nr:hypothetical protein RFI_11012 [Reticulomyxa filosa]|eukprot:ETO26121.1 hypothetical protein RFI_11012 [Reticulomyxa filosa]
MRAQKIEFQKMLEQELEDIKKELDSKFSEFGTRLERYYKRQCLHVHQHRQVVEWYHTQMQLQKLSQTQSNLFAYNNNETTLNPNRHNKSIYSNKTQPYPIPAKWNMDDTESDENNPQMSSKSQSDPDEEKIRNPHDYNGSQNKSPKKTKNKNGKGSNHAEDESQDLILFEIFLWKRIFTNCWRGFIKLNNLLLAYEYIFSAVFTFFLLCVLLVHRFVSTVFFSKLLFVGIILAQTQWKCSVFIVKFRHCSACALAYIDCFSFSTLLNICHFGLCTLIKYHFSFMRFDDDNSLCLL